MRERLAGVEDERTPVVVSACDVDGATPRDCLGCAVAHTPHDGGTETASMKHRLAHRTVSKSLIERVIDAPELARIVHGLTPHAFSSLMQRVGLDDAGALLALATREQLETAFEDDLFAGAGPGTREAFDRSRFIVWLEAMLAEGETFTAERIARLPEDTVVAALSSIVHILDEDALLMRLRGQAPDLENAAAERALSTSIDGYVIEARVEEGFDAASTLIFALDRTRPELLERLLDRCARVSERYVDEGDELSTALSSEGTLAEDVEASREARRARRGYVEARAAKAFLLLAREPLVGGVAGAERDPITLEYFRNLAAPALRPVDELDVPPKLLHAIASLERAAVTTELTGTGLGTQGHAPAAVSPLVEAMRHLRRTDSHAFAERLEEFAYLTNVLMAAGHAEGGARLGQIDAADAVLATVAFGAELLVRSGPSTARRTRRHAGHSELAEVLRKHHADVLFRSGSTTVVNDKLPGASRGYLRSQADLERAVEALRVAETRVHP
jgi:hypothetical protein